MRKVVHKKSPPPPFKTCGKACNIPPLPLCHDYCDIVFVTKLLFHVQANYELCFKIRRENVFELPETEKK